MKAVINTRYGGFSLASQAVELLKELGCPHGPHTKWSHADASTRTCVALCKIVEELGEYANGECATLKVIDAGEPLLNIEDHDGKEEIHGWIYTGEFR